MKIRNGFVSNSSSSSFCIYGVYLEEGDIGQKLLDTLELEKYEGRLEVSEAIADKFNLTTSCGPYGCDGIYIGLSWDSIKDDQTGLQFKNEVKAKIKELTGVEMACSTHTEAWYDG